MRERAEVAGSGKDSRMDANGRERGRMQRSGTIAAVGAVAAAYVYFLVFAEFALLRLAETRAAEWPLRAVMAVLGAGGVAGSVAAWRGWSAARARGRLAAGFLVAAAGAGAALAARNGGIFVAATAVVGVALGAVTVTLAAMLRVSAGATLGRVCGAGTGLAYALCNVPAVFAARAETQTGWAIGAALGGAVAARWLRADEAERETTGEFGRSGVAGWVVVLLALVWMDSAAFWVIQHTENLRAGTWTGAWRLWGNAAVHLAAALAAGWALDRGAAGRVIAAAGAGLLAACALLSAGGSATMAAVLYTAGVSLYSTALVWYPARSGRAGVAALVYAVAGWGGSALGIGMAQDRAGIPVAFVMVAAVVLAAAMWGRRKFFGAGALIVVVAGGLGATDARAQEAALVARGREVYVAEGCVNCHSQYVRPGVTTDVERWGPARSLAAAKAERPPLFGNRRQGPDLAAVGARRSAEWQRLHLEAPRALVPGSRMPAYAYLFSGDEGRGEALVAYLLSLGGEALAARWEAARRWRPAEEAVAPAWPDEERGRRMFAQWCAACHGAAGRGDGPVAATLSVRPPDWTRDPWRWVAADEREVTLALARIVKFGLPGSPMAGHEYFSDAETVALARFVARLHNGGSEKR